MPFHRVPSSHFIPITQEFSEKTFFWISSLNYSFYFGECLAWSAWRSVNKLELRLLLHVVIPQKVLTKKLTQ